GFYNIVVTYDATSAANVPSIYINGVAQTVSTVSTVSGGSWLNVAGPLYVGYNGQATSPNGYMTFDGRYYRLQVYDRILTAAQAEELYNGWGVDGLMPVFDVRFLGVGGLQAYDGTTLGTSNQFVDEISGTTGAPASGTAAVGYADDRMAIGGD
ncbi:hypothetical protein D6833_03610, partial [Candidatus Parcubacteria bacterium]